MTTDFNSLDKMQFQHGDLGDTGEEVVCLCAAMIQ